MPTPRPAAKIAGPRDQPSSATPTETGRLVALAKMSMPVVLQLLVGAGLIAVLLVGLVTGASARGLRAALRALLTPAA